MQNKVSSALAVTLTPPAIRELVTFWLKVAFLALRIKPPVISKFTDFKVPVVTSPVINALAANPPAYSI